MMLNRAVEDKVIALHLQPHGRDLLSLIAMDLEVSSFIVPENVEVYGRLPHSHINDNDKDDEKIDAPDDVEFYGLRPRLYCNDNEKHYYDLNPQWSLELKKVYAAFIVRPDPEEISRPSTLALDKEPMVWIFRRQLVERQRLDLYKELSDVELAMKKDSKNYQSWRHRKWIALKLGTNAANRELELTEMLIHEDANNFHAWYHRQWVLEAIGGDWEQEIAYCDRVLGEDISNSFAWDQRYFVVTRSPMLGGMEVARDKEVDYALQAIASKPWIECPWTYIQRLYADDSQSLVSNSWVEDTCLCVLNSYIDLVEGSMVGEGNVVSDASLRCLFACANALFMVWHLIKLGLRPGEKWISVIEALTRSDIQFVKELESTLQLARCDLSELLSSLGRARMPENHNLVDKGLGISAITVSLGLSRMHRAGMSERRNLFDKRLRWGAITLLFGLGLKCLLGRHR